MSQNKRLLPPIIEGTLPAFYGTALTVPFSMNKAVSNNEIGGFCIKVKTVQSNAYIGYSEYYRNVEGDMSNEVIFDISKMSSKFNVGQYYKIQMAYIDKNGNEGYYSTVGIAKFTTQPEVTVERLISTEINRHIYNYTGKYSQENGDSTEKVYSYCFNFYDINMSLVLTSGWKLHNTNNDEFAYESIDNYQIEKELEVNKKYYLQYSIITNNRMRISSPLYTIIRNLSIDPEAKISIEPVNNFDNGYIELFLKGETDPETNIEYAVTGSFKIVRASEKDNYQTWNEVLRFNLYGQQPSRSLWKDFTVEQGINYQYALQQYNDKGLTSNRITSSLVYADFEDAFLYDGKRQLKIRYNPKVSSFKNNIMETKIDTIGSKFPYIFRNGNVKYKEFPISGLISYYMDEKGFFKDTSNYSKGTNLISDNLSQEREFKLEVMDWLNNGEMKLFRSPGEGNYIVRLMNISLTPTDTLGRMIHTFSCNAYEMADFSFDNLSSFGFLQTVDPSIKQLRWETINLNMNPLSDNLLIYEAVALKFEGLVPGDVIYIDDSIYRENITYQDGHASGFYITIGITGSYVLELQNNVKISKVQFINNSYQHQGILTYAYYSKLINSFDLISSFTSKEIPLEQFIGETNIINKVNDVKNEIQTLLYGHFSQRQVQIAYIDNNNKLWANEAKTVSLKIEPYLLYAIYSGSRYSAEYEIDPITNQKIYKENTPIGYWDGYKYLYYGKDYEFQNIDNSIQINGVNIDLTEILEYQIYNLTPLTEFKIGNGVIAECSYQLQIKEYSLENSLEMLGKEINNYCKTYGINLNLSSSQNYILKELYQEKEKILQELIHSNTINEELSDSEREDQIAVARKEKEIVYQLFIEELEKAIKERQEMQGESVS